MNNSEQFVSDLKGVLTEENLNDQELIANALFTMEHFDATDYLIGGKYTKTGKVAKFIFEKIDRKYSYLRFVQDQPFSINGGMNDGRF